MKLKTLLRHFTASIATVILAGTVAPVAHAQEANTRKLSDLPREIKMVRMRDGSEIALAIYRPSGNGPFPTLLAASPYRLDNDDAPALGIFPFKETGPIPWYIDHGYAFVRMDVRGTGRSGGVYRFQDKMEQRDLYEIVEWIARQSWSNKKVGGIGQSAYARSQWFAAVQAPPHLSCVAPYDGNIDTYRASAYTGGVPGTYPAWWFNYVRGLNMSPFHGKPREIPWDYPREITRHRTYDAFWQERAVADRLASVKIPVFSIGVWGKVDLHLNGNVVGYQQVSGPKKLLVLGGAGVDAAVAEFSSPAFHEKYLLPFYDWCLKGEQTTYLAEPEVRYAVTGTSDMRTAVSWPPAEIKYQTYYLGPEKSGSVTSLNDGSLSTEKPSASGGTTLNYPQEGWSQTGVIGRGTDGRPDSARYVLTFTSKPMDSATTVAGPMLLKLSLTSSRNDADILAKIYEQFAQSDEDRKKGLQPQARLVTKGWLRASHREADPLMSKENAPWYKHTTPSLLEPGKVYDVDVAIMPTAVLFKKGSRIRIEIANSDSILTEAIFAHAYYPDQVGSYTILHDADHTSRLIVPVLPSAE
jgi:predicted acyl esterase